MTRSSPTRFTRRIQIVDGVLYDESVDISTLGVGGGQSEKTAVTASEDTLNPKSTKRKMKA